MIVRKFEDILPSARAVHTDTWSSFRLLTRADGMGFSLHETWIHPGTQTHIWYKHHAEAVYCIEGEGEIEPLDAEGRSAGAPVPIKPGVMYALDAHDRHFLRARTRLRLICVFNPPLRGDETHGPDGAYAAPEALPDRDMPEAALADSGTLVAPAPRAATPPAAVAATLEAEGKAALRDPAAATPAAGAPATTAGLPRAARLNGHGLEHVNGDSDEDETEDQP